MGKIWRAHTTFILVIGIVAIVIATAIAFMALNFQPRTEIRLGSGVFRAKVADTNDLRVLGLSGVTSLKSNEALLMVFESDAQWGIWMKDMKIPLDIIWLDKDKKVVHIVKNAAPELSTSEIFTPKDPARYVLEVAAGTTVNSGIKIGDTADFTLASEVSEE